VPSARKPFSAPPTAKPAALLCADADVDADADGAALVAAKVEVPRLKSAFVSTPEHDAFACLLTMQRRCGSPLSAAWF